MHGLDFFVENIVNSKVWIVWQCFRLFATKKASSRQ